MVNFIFGITVGILISAVVVIGSIYSLHKKINKEIDEFIVVNLNSHEI